MNKPNIQEYINMLGDIPSFLNKYLDLKILKRLKKVGYFCGMDYGSKHIYDFGYKISRYDHSLTTALITWKFTKDKRQTLLALFHDVSTPCFSHVIDYMNEDYEKQESTEEYTEEIIKKDNYVITKYIEDVNNITKEAVMEAVSQDKEVTLNNLANVQKQIESGEITKEHVAQLSTLIQVEAQVSVKYVHAARTLAEVQLRMTIDANIRLLKSDYSIDTAPLTELVEALKQQEENLAVSFFGKENSFE